MTFLRVGICVLLAFGVLAFGGVEEWAQAVLEVGFSALFIAWAVRQYWQKSEQVQLSPLFLPLAAFALVAVIQLVFHTTASHYNTRMELQILAAYLMALFLMPQAWQRVSDWRGALWFLMTLGFCVSVLGLLQSLTFNGRLYWVRVLRYGGTPFGPYVNRNHFAGFAELIIPVALVPLVLGRVRRERLFLVALFALVPTVALILSASRGGIISFGIEMIILFMLLLARRIRVKYVVAGGLLILCAVVAVLWIGAQGVLQRFAEHQTVGATMGKRISMQRDTLRIFLDHPVLGTGLGTLQRVFPRYDSLYDGKIVNHTHNDYLEALAETGVLGGLCCLWFLGVLLRESMKGLTEHGNSFGSALNLSGLVGCSGFLVHSLVDFNLHIPANALLFFISAHLATARVQSSNPGVASGASWHQRRRGHRLNKT